MRKADITMRRSKNDLIISIKKGNKEIRIKISDYKHVFAVGFCDEIETVSYNSKNIDIVWQQLEDFINGNN